MNRPTISLVTIAKNEAENLPILHKSIEGCFDEWILIDTGSTDKTVEIAKSLGATVHDFKWVNDFSAARNECLKYVKSEYWMWMDLDDSLQNKEAFLFWRDNVMVTAEYWLAVYHYAIDEQKKPTCSFARERVLKTECGFKWDYPIHEGLKPAKIGGETAAANYASNWAVVHRRTQKDLDKDRGRNLAILEKMENKDSRMKYYYGKELFENKQPLEAYQALIDVVGAKDLEIHDRILGIQYACLSAMQINQFERAIALAHQGLQLASNRAEFFVVIADCLSKLNRLKDAIPFYQAARFCKNPEDMGMGRAGAIFIHKEAYDSYPIHQLARVYFHLGDIEASRKTIEALPKDRYTDETKALIAEIERVDRLSQVVAPGTAKKCEDIVISCPPGGLYEWDETLEKTQGMGGSEIAAIRMARELHVKTKRKVIVFNSRKEAKTVDGVEYRPVQTINEYMLVNEPACHIAWRHNIKITHAPTYLWCHDLHCMGMENHANYDKLLVLSDFHKKFVQGLFSIPEEKILVTRNGINIDLFKTAPKNSMKVVYASSPDRGLERAIKVVEAARNALPKLELHCFYGVDNMIKMGRTEEATRILDMINERPWCKMHGNIQQEQLAKELSDASCWVYPTNFLETFCCTALEMLCAGVYPVVRKYGALADTLKDMPCTMLDLDCDTPEKIKTYAQALVAAVREESWKKVAVNKQNFGWDSVADEWIQFMGL